jgi:glycerol uptake facilitator-like aquaporin
MGKPYKSSHSHERSVRSDGAQAQRRAQASVSKAVPRLSRRLLAEALGSYLLFGAIALLGNTMATGAMLFVIITMLAPISGAHFNPAVSAVMASRGELAWRDAAAYTIVQLVAGVLGAWTVHAMFDLPVLQFSSKLRAGLGQGIGEALATFGLILTIIGTARERPAWLPASVALYIVAAYWFTSSTSFANPAITVARSLSNSFAGISPESVPVFLLAQTAGAALGGVVGRVVFQAET